LPFDIKLRYAARLEFQCTDNIAEYEAIILALSKLRALSSRRAIIKTDSQVISGLIEKNYKGREPRATKIPLHILQNRGILSGNHNQANSQIRKRRGGRSKHSCTRHNPTSDVFYKVISQPMAEVNLKAPKLINAIHSED
jgi:ribonuclease HI